MTKTLFRIVCMKCFQFVHSLPMMLPIRSFMLTALVFAMSTPGAIEAVQAEGQSGLQAAHDPGVRPVGPHEVACDLAFELVV